MARRCWIRHLSTSISTETKRWASPRQSARRADAKYLFGALAVWFGLPFGLGFTASIVASVSSTMPRLLPGPIGEPVHVSFGIRTYQPSPDAWSSGSFMGERSGSPMLAQRGCE